jgi:hypothetical protein
MGTMETKEAKYVHCTTMSTGPACGRNRVSDVLVVLSIFLLLVEKDRIRLVLAVRCADGPDRAAATFRLSGMLQRTLAIALREELGPLSRGVELILEPPRTYQTTLYFGYLTGIIGTLIWATATSYPNGHLNSWDNPRVMRVVPSRANQERVVRQTVISLKHLFSGESYGSWPNSRGLLLFPLTWERGSGPSLLFVSSRRFSAPRCWPSLGLRHAVDADHIAAIDNVTET